MEGQERDEQEPESLPEETPQDRLAAQAKDQTTQKPGASEGTKLAIQESPFVLMTEAERSQVIASTALPQTGTPSPEQAQVHIAPNLLDLTTGRVETSAEKKQAREQHDLNHVIHSMLIVGLAISTVLMLIGIALEIILRQDLPTVEPDLSQVFERVIALRPSGFLALGLLVLLATPVLRVVGSILAFAYERDWRFAGITLVVLIIVISSILLGKG